MGTQKTELRGQAAAAVFEVPEGLLKLHALVAESAGEVARAEQRLEAAQASETTALCFGGAEEEGAELAAARENLESAQRKQRIRAEQLEELLSETVPEVVRALQLRNHHRVVDGYKTLARILNQLVAGCGELHGALDAVNAQHNADRQEALKALGIQGNHPHALRAGLNISPCEVLAVDLAMAEDYIRVWRDRYVASHN